MALPRPYWRGYLKLSLVSCPIALYTAASSSERVSFRQINKATGNRLKQQLVDEVTREPVESENKGRGYEYAKNAYVLVDDEELDAVALESSHTVEIDKFVPRAEIDERYFDTPYYIAPNDQVGQEAFAVIREAMRGKEMAALARIVIAKRERVMMLQPWERGILGVSLRYAYELRDTKEYFSEIPDMAVPKDMRQLAEHILETKAAEFEPSEFVDRYEEAVVEMLKKKQAGLPAPRERAAPPPANVINLMDALKRSLANENKPAAPAKRMKKKIDGQREMLLPLAGKGKEKEKDKEKVVAHPAAATRRRKAG
ncbi:MAG TPA: Ku protein [Stellaceae bacterium]|nr:Ku protein [Stellaceae bacterium]